MTLLQLVILVQDAVAVIIRVFIIFKTVAIIVLVAVQDTVTVVVVILCVGLTISVEILVFIEDAVTVIIFVVDIKEAVIVVIVIFGVLDAIAIGVIITCTSLILRSGKIVSKPYPTRLTQGVRRPRGDQAKELTTSSCGLQRSNLESHDNKANYF